MVKLLKISSTNIITCCSWLFFLISCCINSIIWKFMHKKKFFCTKNIQKVRFIKLFIGTIFIILMKYIIKIIIYLLSKGNLNYYTDDWKESIPWQWTLISELSVTLFQKFYFFLNRFKQKYICGNEIPSKSSGGLTQYFSARKTQ